MYTSIFGLTADTCVDYTHGDCRHLAFYLFKLMKDNKIKCSIYDSSSDDCDYIHTVVKWKNKYIDILGLHTFDELYDNHVMMYPLHIMQKTLFLDKISDAYENCQSYLKYSECYHDHVSIRDAEKTALKIFDQIKNIIQLECGD